MNDNTIFSIGILGAGGAVGFYFMGLAFDSVFRTMHNKQTYVVWIEKNTEMVDRLMRVINKHLPPLFSIELNFSQETDNSSVLLRELKKRQLICGGIGLIITGVFFIDPGRFKLEVQQMKIR